MLPQLMLPIYTSAPHLTSHQLKHTLICPVPLCFIPRFIHPQLSQQSSALIHSQLSRP
jgi:hypothetical protein